MHRSLYCAEQGDEPILPTQLDHAMFSEFGDFGY